MYILWLNYQNIRISMARREQNVGVLGLAERGERRRGLRPTSPPTRVTSLGEGGGKFKGENLGEFATPTKGPGNDCPREGPSAGLCSDRMYLRYSVMLLSIKTKVQSDWLIEIFVDFNNNFERVATNEDN